MVNQLTALASSSLNTSMDDFLVWMRNYETGQVGGAETLERMLLQGVLNDCEVLSYAYGLTRGEYRGLPTFGHGGSWAGFRTNFVRFPEQNLSVAVFCNVSDCDPAGRARRVAEVFLEAEMSPAPDRDSQQEQQKSVTLSLAQLREYEGWYRSVELDSSYEVVADGGELTALHWRNRRANLTPIGDDEFRGDVPWLPLVRFTRDGSGRLNSFTVTGSRVRNMVFERRRP